MTGSESPRELPFPELLRRFADQTTRLIRAEIELARSEFGEKVAGYGRSAGAFGGAALLGVGAFGTFTAAVIAALALVMPTWAGALIVTILYAAIAFALFRRAQKTLRQLSLIPTQAVETTKEDIEWAKTRATSARK
jgi:uncharacterized protein (DUF697 family)